MPDGCRVDPTERVAAGMAQHVRVRLELQPGDGSGALDHAGEAGRGERFRHGQSMTSAQNNAHHTSTGCMIRRGP
jgi:hypothetical protein